MRNETREFIERLLKRRPQLGADVEMRLRLAREQESAAAAQDAGAFQTGAFAASVMETIVSEQRPVFFVAADAAGAATIDFADAAVRGEEARFLKQSLEAGQAKLTPLFSRIGRIDVVGMTGADYVGTGWIIDDGIVVTNRHVAEVVARRSSSGYSFRIGAAGFPVSLGFSPGRLRGEAETGVSIPVASVLYIEPEESAVDIAFLKLSMHPAAGTLAPLPIGEARVDDNAPLCVIGYPAKASAQTIPDQTLMQDLYRGVYDVKRVAPGFVARQDADLVTHDCTTLGGNSGSALVAMDKGEVVGLHFAGIYRKENQAVPARLLREYRDRRRWTRPVTVETPKPAAAAVAAAGATAVTITIRIEGGAPAVTISDANAPRGVEAVERAAAALLRRGPRPLVSARVGYPEDDDAGPVIVATAPQGRMAEAATWPASFDGVPVRYEAATLIEQLDAMAQDEAAAAIAYDDEARTGPEFALDPITEEMTVRAHLSPEYGFEELVAFFQTAQGPLESAMYEAQGERMAELLEAALARGLSMNLTADPKSKPPAPGKVVEDDPLVTPVSAHFDRWASEHAFLYQIVPFGRRGLVASAYHTKVTVDGDDRFWLSSGNWKNRSSQPLVDEALRRRATEDDLPGNRDWHLIVQNRTLAGRMRSHIRQDFQRSKTLAAEREAVAVEPMVLTAAVAEAVEERRPPNRVLPPLDVTGRIRAHPLMTPDRGGRAYADPVLELIRSARRSLLFQIPYIGMRRDPSVHRGIIDELIDALVEKLTTLDDARVLLRTGNDKFSDNRHVSWYFRSRGVDGKRLRQLPDHHTKGMIVDGKRVMIGSHNWSSQGVSVNRDASIIFDDNRLAGYFGEAFEIDWDRSSAVSSRRFVPEMPELLNAGVEAAVAGGAARPLREVLAEYDD